MLIMNWKAIFLLFFQQMILNGLSVSERKINFFIIILFTYLLEALSIYIWFG